MSVSVTIFSAPQEHEILEAAGGSLVFPCYRQSVSRANPRIDPRHDALPDVDAVCCLRNALVCAGCDSYSNTFVGSTIFVPGRSSLVGRPIPCSRTVKGRRSDFAGRPSTPLTALRVHDLMLFSRQQPNASTLSHRLERLRRAASLCHLSVLLVSRFVLAACARAERCREHPRSGSSVRCSGTLGPTLAGFNNI